MIVIRPGKYLGIIIIEIPAVNVIDITISVIVNAIARNLSPVFVQIEPLSSG